MKKVVNFLAKLCDMFNRVIAVLNDISIINLYRV